MKFTTPSPARELVGAHLRFLAWPPAIDLKSKKLEPAMSGQDASGLQIDHEHCRAICDEIGDRLRIILDREVTELPPRLKMLLNRLAEAELEPAPSIVPSMDDMDSWPPLPAHIGARASDVD